MVKQALSILERSRQQLKLAEFFEEGFRTYETGRTWNSADGVVGSTNDKLDATYKLVKDLVTKSVLSPPDTYSAASVVQVRLQRCAMPAGMYPRVCEVSIRPPRPCEDVHTCLARRGSEMFGEIRHCFAVAGLSANQPLVLWPGFPRRRTATRSMMAARMTRVTKRWSNPSCI